MFAAAINEQRLKSAQNYPTNSKTSLSDEPFLMRSLDCGAEWMILKGFPIQEPITSDGQGISPSVIQLDFATIDP